MFVDASAIVAILTREADADGWRTCWRALLRQSQSLSLIRLMSASESVRAAGLKRKCRDKGASPSKETSQAIAVEIERQLDYIPGEDHDSGASPAVAI